MTGSFSRMRKFCFWFLALTLTVLVFSTTSVFAAEEEAPAADTAAPQMGIREMFEAGGVIGILILVLSVGMVALIVEHLISIRHNALMPPGLAENVHQAISQQRYQEADQLCKNNPGFLGQVLSAGLAEMPLGYSSMEKAMEDASVQQSARLFRKIEYLSLIGTIAPMLGLLGTVWGIMQAFLQFSVKANPQVSELAPGIYKALVTTFLGLSVAVPALASFALLRNRIDELVAEASLLAERVFVDYKRALANRKKKASPAAQTAQPGYPQANTPSVTINRKD